MTTVGTGGAPGAGSRLAGLRYEDLDESQRVVWDAVTDGRRGATSQLVADGSLIGPFNAMLYSPHVGARVTALGEALRFESNLDPALREVAILTAGAHWRSEFEFWAHSRIGADVGLDDATIEGIAAGSLPRGAPAEVALVHRAARRIINEGRLDDGTYAEVVDLVGEEGTVDLVALLGYYTLISLTLNTFRVPLPDGVPPRWP